MRGFQLWINLPAAQKMDAPEYQEYKTDAFPVVESDGVIVKVVVGDYGETSSPIKDDTTEVRYLDVSVDPGNRFVYPLPAGHNSFIYLFEGDGTVDTRRVDDRMLATLSGEDFEFIAGETGARFLLVTGKPINEPVVQYGPFVMNTREEIDQAMQDYQSNNFVRDKAWVNRQSITAKTKGE